MINQEQIDSLIDLGEKGAMIKLQGMIIRGKYDTAEQIRGLIHNIVMGDDKLMGVDDE